MGLDMNLYKKTYVKNWQHMKPEELHEITVKRGGKTVPKSKIDPAKIAYVVEDAGYWRKSNQIHNWFVEAVQNGNDDCGTYYVSPEQLADLLDLVNQVLADHSKAGELLPTQSGFFFGSTEYDKWYFGDLEETKKILTEALADPNAAFEYSSSW